MSSLNIKEIKLNDFLLKNFNGVISLKRDGCMMYFKNNNLISDRNIIRNDRFPEITAILRKNNFPECIGEMYVEGGNVFDISRKENWHKAKFMPFSILNCHNVATELEIIMEAVKMINNPKLTSLVLFKDIKTAWDFVIQNNQEGLILKSGYGWYKIKKLMEGKFKIAGYEKGKDKGTFILENGSRISGTSMGIVNKYFELAKICEPMAEVEYCFITDSGKLFQPRLRRIYAEI